MLVKFISNKKTEPITIIKSMMYEMGVIKPEYPFCLNLFKLYYLLDF